MAKTWKDLPVERIFPANHVAVLVMLYFTIRNHPPLLLYVDTLVEEFGVTGPGFAILRRNGTTSGTGSRSIPHASVSVQMRGS